MAAALAAGPHAVLSHWSAAALWMIRPNGRFSIDVTTPHKSRSWDGIKRHHKALPPDEGTVRNGIPVTTVPRTIFDLAATEDVDAVAAMLRESEHRNLWDRLSLPDLVDRYPGRRGVKKVRLALQRVTEEPTGRKRSRLEQRFAPFLRRQHLPMPRFNDWILLGPKRYPGPHPPLPAEVAVGAAPAEADRTNLFPLSPGDRLDAERGPFRMRRLVERRGLVFQPPREGQRPAGRCEEAGEEDRSAAAADP